MKKVYVFLLPLAMLLCACCAPSANAPEPCRRAGGPAAELSAIDSLMWRQPDSAFALLQQFAVSPATDSLDEYNTHYFHLLLAELLYKNDCAQTNRPNVLQAADYFDSLTINSSRASCRHCGRVPQSPNLCCDFPFLDARAHYINGVGYYGKDSVVQACAEYLEALEVMESNYEEKDLVGLKAQFMALTYTRLTVLFSDHYLHEQAIYFDKATLAFYNKYEAEIWHIAWLLDEAGTQYDMMENYDTAYYYYNAGLSMLSDTNTLTYRDISTHITYLFYKKGGDSEIALKRLKSLISQAESEEEALARYAIIGEIFFHEQELDSAYVYLNEVFQNSEITDSKKQAAEWLVEINKTFGKESEIILYAEYLVPFANKEENKSSVKSQLTEMYNTYRQKELERKHIRIIRKSTKKALIIVCGLLVAFLAVLFISVWRKKSFKTQLKAENQAHKTKQKALSGRLRTSNEALRDTLMKLEEKEAELKTIENNNTKRFDTNSYEVFMEALICREILNTVDNLHSDKRKTLKTDMVVTEYKAFALSLSQKAQLSKTVETVFPHLHDSLGTIYPSLDRNEWLHCCLYLLQLDKMSICVLLQEPYYTCRRCTLKLEEAFNCRRGLAAFLIEQAKGF